MRIIATILTIVFGAIALFTCVALGWLPLPFQPAPQSNRQTIHQSIHQSVPQSIHQTPPQAVVQGAPLPSTPPDCRIFTHRLDEGLLPLDAKSYRLKIETCHSQSDTWISLRSFSLGQVPYRWAITPDHLTSAIISESCLRDCTSISDTKNIPGVFGEELRAATDPPYPLANDGLVRAPHPRRDQMYLTIDLCPAHGPMDRKFFSFLTERIEKPLPIELSVAGLWLRHHASDLEYLLRLEDAGKIQITWVNHGYYHPYTPGLKNAENYDLTKGTDFTKEVLENEKLMLNQGLIPAPFFRFPGLISNQKLILKLRKWGLIPLAADAWLANGGTPQPGSFILVHGNGNEPHGLKLFRDLIKKDPELLSRLRDLSEAID